MLGFFERTESFEHFILEHWPEVVMFVIFQANRGIDCLELPLVQHTQLPDFDKLSHILSSKPHMQDFVSHIQANMTVLHCPLCLMNFGISLAKVRYGALVFIIKANKRSILYEKKKSTVYG